MADTEKKITKKDVENLSLVARLKLSEEEVSSFVEDFNNTFNYISSDISSVNTHNVEPLYKVVPNKMVLREDIIEESMLRDELLFIAPEKTNKFLKVPKII